MIDWLEIKQFVIADHLELEFDGRFTTITGETGSGKSLIVDAIGLLLGQRSDNSYIRHNHDIAELQASFDLPADHLESMQRELAGLKDPQRELKRLNDLLKIKSEKYQRIATKISINRKKSTKRLASRVTTLMQELGMKGGEFNIRRIPIATGSYTRFGNETVEFVVTANPGQPLQSLTKVVSGGELSRISLAIQVVLANKTQASTLIFDEVDVGIGGEIAHVVGQKLKELGKSNQVICITHLSQVAAQGDYHFSVSKQGDKQVAARVVKLNSEQRIAEIARMTDGKKITQQSRAHAQQMLESA